MAETIAIENVNTPGKTTNVDRAKYEAMRDALFAVVPSEAPGLTHREIVDAVRPHLPQDLFPGGAQAMWWSKTVQLDLEAKGQLVRTDTKPLRWYRS